MKQGAIMKKRFYCHTMAAGAALLAAPSFLHADEVPANRPNVLFISVDDLNDWVGYLGGNAQTLTPNMDALAARGVWFTRNYCAAPACSPSRASLMSGFRPTSTGIYSNNERFETVIPEELTLTTQFRKAGYFVYGSGKIYHGSVYRAGEWDEWKKGTSGKIPKSPTVYAGNFDITPLDCPDEEMMDYRTVDNVIAQLNKKHDKPFFLACGIYLPHLPFSVPKKYYDKFPIETIQLPAYKEDDLDDLPPTALKMVHSFGDHEAILKQDGTNTWKQAVRAYLASINFCDAMIGRLMEAYDKSPERDNTIIVLWSDHGWDLGQKNHWRKFGLWETTTRAPLIWVVPGLTRPDSRCDRTVDLMSVYPTLLDLCGIPVPPHVEGESIRPLLANPQMPWDKPAIITYQPNNHSIRSEGWRYTRYGDGGEELYDETADPNEWDNLAKDGGGDSALKAELRRYMPKENKPRAASKPAKD
jgi:arylsulfatase A-like enzyme